MTGLDPDMTGPLYDLAELADLLEATLADTEPEPTR
jgi:hypothetical protein